MLARTLAALLALAAAAHAQSAEEFSFDAAEFRKKPAEIGGYLELKQQQFRLNRDGAFYQTGFYNQPRSRLDESTVTLKPAGKYRTGPVSFNFRAHVEGDWETRGFERTFRFDELYLSHKPVPGFTLDAGKISLKWGKGYAWNPVGFVERIKDPNDPDLAREGFTMLTVDVIRNFDGPLRTVAFTPVLIPVSSDMNTGFGTTGHVNVAAKLYLLWHDTDIDFMFLGNGSRSRRFGFDFSRNLTSNFEIHGEWARVEDPQRQVMDAAGNVTTVRRSSAVSYLLGMRYLTARDTTYIFEYYRNGAGYSEAETRDYFNFVDAAYLQFLSSGTDTALRRAGSLGRTGYARPNPGRNYLYLRISQKEPFDILYLTPALTVIANADDRSRSIVPELLYTGINDLELRARVFFLAGGANTEFGEKQNARRIELQARFHF